MPIELRDARPDDLAAIFAIYNDEVLNGTATFDTEPRVRGRDDRWLTERDPARHPVIVAEDGRRVVGWASLSAWSPRGGYDRTAEESVYVHASRRGEGIGGLLLTALVERARDAELGVVVARIVAAHPASIRLHRSVGFASIGTMRRCGEKFGRVLDVELMDLQLDER